MHDIALREALEERYLAYALSTIMHRALPDVRDGLKPVHRRILYAMRLLRLDPGSAFKKSAKIVGDVMGNFHPHGDQAIYDALVRLAQDFASRYPLVDGQGNFGNIDGDNAAAMRYTEARLTEAARLLLDGIDEDAVDFRPTYDGVKQEPVVLPAAFPNLLANGAQGIAVGMATAIPPHNIAELCDAALYLIEQPNARTRTLLKYVPGPDFPTGGLIVDPPETIAEAYKTGRGSFRLRARWKTEDTGRGTFQIVVTEIPWQVQKMRLVEQIAELMNERKLPLVADMRDESAEDVRLVFEPRSRTVDPALMMESLFKLSELESRVPLNMNVLVGGRVPRVVGLAEALTEWLTYRREVLLRRSRYRLAQIEHRLEVLGGYLVAYLNLDKVIKIIRTEDEPKPVLMKTFKLSDVQAEAILNMRLRNLRKLEEMEIREEDKTLRAEKKSIENLLRSEKEQWKTIAGQIREVREKFGPKTPLGKRRTGFAQAPAHDEAAIEEALVEREPVTVVVSEKGWIRALQRPGRRSVQPVVQDRRLARSRLLRRDHVENSGIRHQRTLLHDRCCQAAGRTRPRRAGPAVHRARAAGGHRRCVPLPGRPQADRRQQTGQGLHRRRGRMPRQYPQGQAGAQRQAAGCGTRAGAGRRRTGCRHRRQPQDGRVPDRAGARNDARSRRAAAASQGWRAVRHQDLRSREGPDVDRLRRPRVHAVAEGTLRLARQPGRRRATGTEGLSEEQQVRRQGGVNSGERQGRRGVDGSSSHPLVPAKAGTQRPCRRICSIHPDSRLRGIERQLNCSISA